MSKCGICKRGMRDGEEFTNIRAGAEVRLSEVKGKLPISDPNADVKEGLYAACGECASVLRPYAAKRYTDELREQERVQALIERRPPAEIPDVDPATMSPQFLA